MVVTWQDRIGLLHTLSTLPEHPESVPINALGEEPVVAVGLDNQSTRRGSLRLEWSGDRPVCRA